MSSCCPGRLCGLDLRQWCTLAEMDVAIVAMPVLNQTNQSNQTMGLLGRSHGFPGDAYAISAVRILTSFDISTWTKVGYLPDGTAMNTAGNAVNHPETIGPDPHTPGFLAFDKWGNEVQVETELICGFNTDTICRNHQICRKLRIFSVNFWNRSWIMLNQHVQNFLIESTGLTFSGSPLPRALFVNDVGYLPDGTPLNRAGNAINHPEPWLRCQHIGVTIGVTMSAYSCYFMLFWAKGAHWKRFVSLGSSLWCFQVLGWGSPLRFLHSCISSSKRECTRTCKDYSHLKVCRIFLWEHLDSIFGCIVLWVQAPQVLCKYGSSIYSKKISKKWNSRNSHRRPLDLTLIPLAPLCHLRPMLRTSDIWSMEHPWMRRATTPSTESLRRAERLLQLARFTCQFAQSLRITPLRKTWTVDKSWTSSLIKSSGNKLKPHVTMFCSM